MEQVILEGSKKFRKDIGLSEAELGDLSAPMARVAGIVLSAARATVPRLTGALAASMYPRSGPTMASVGTTSIYAEPIHWGWPARNIEANPWLTEAARQSEPTWIREIERHVDEAIGRMDKNYT